MSAPDLARRALLSALAAGAAGWALWPVRSRRAPAGRTVLTYWEKWTGTEGDAIQRVVDRFNLEQQKLFVERIPVSDLTQKALVAIAGGDPPDLVGLYNYNLPLYAQSGAAMALDEFPQAPELDPSRYAPSVDRMLTHEGKRWAGVSTCYSIALYCNRNMFRRAGLDPQRDLPATTEELDAIVERFTRRDDRGNYAELGFLPGLPDWWPYLWPILHDATLYDPVAERATTADADVVAAYEWVQSFARRFGAESSLRFISGFGRAFSSAEDPFLAERVAMITQGPWIANFASRYASRADYVAIPLPVPRAIYDPARPVGMIEADVVIIPRGCPHPQESFEFLRWLQRQDVLESLASDHGKGSPLVQTSASFHAAHPNRSVAVHDQITRSPRAHVAPGTRSWPQYANLMRSAYESIWSGADVRTVLTETAQRTQALLDAAARLRRVRRGDRA